MTVSSGVVRAKAIKSLPFPGAQLRAGIVGAGLMGRWHAKAIKRAGGTVIAIADLDPEAARRLAASSSGAKSFTDVEEMLDCADLDVLHICTSPLTHNALAELALDAGLNVIIEKPATATSSELERLLDRAAERGVLLCPVHQFLFQDGTQKARRLLPRVGSMVHVDATISSAGGQDLSHERLDGIVADILPHPLSLMQLLLAKGISEDDWITMRPGHGEFRAICQMSGISLSIFISMNGRPTNCSLQIVGTGGTIELDLFHGYAVLQSGEVSRARKLVNPFDLASRRLLAAALNIGRRASRLEFAYPGLRRLVGDFYKAVQTGNESPISREDTLAVARVRDILIRDAGLA